MKFIAGIVILLIMLLYITSIAKKEYQTQIFDIRKVLPMSGSEPEYNPQQWNKDSIQSTHNCYAYLLDDIMPNIQKFPQPGVYGYINQSPGNNIESGGFTDDDTCDTMFKKMQNDIPETYRVNVNDRCMPGFYKGYFALDPGDDYHYFRQDSTGMFSHKPGKLKIFQLDSDGKAIYRPDLSEKNYGKTTNYTDNCYYFCVPVNTNVKYASLYS